MSSKPPTLLRVLFGPLLVSKAALIAQATMWDLEKITSDYPRRRRSQCGRISRRSLICRRRRVDILVIPGS